MSRLYQCVFCIVVFCISTLTVHAANQTATVETPASGDELPFRINIERVGFDLPRGWQSGVFGEHQGLWVLIAGRNNGLHGFTNVGSFPALAQNAHIYVVDPTNGVVHTRSILDPGSGLTSEQIDSLTVTNPQAYQDGTTLYMTGGYAWDRATNAYITYPYLTAINLPGLIDWVLDQNNPNYSVANNIRQITSSIFQVAGGEMFKIGKTTQLVFGQNYSGEYTTANNGVYTHQVRRFEIVDTDGQLSIRNMTFTPQDPSFRRRDGNIVPYIFAGPRRSLEYGLIAYAGVFTLTSGVWTVPVTIDETNNPSMPDPNLSETFKQGMNHYLCATAPLYSRREQVNYHLFFGGMSYGFFSGGAFQTDTEVPFTSEVTTIKRNRDGSYKQYIMDGQYPTIASTTVNPGNSLLFGSNAYFIPNPRIRHFANTVIDIDSIREPTVIGHIVGGIASTLPNVSVVSDSFASTYIFKVTLIPK